MEDIERNEYKLLSLFVKVGWVFIYPIITLSEIGVIYPFFANSYLIAYVISVFLLIDMHLVSGRLTEI